MRALVGDRLVVNSRRVGQPVHAGEIIEVILAADGAEMYRVMWSDGRQTVMCPGSDALVEPRDEIAADTRETYIVGLDLRIEEDTQRCDATATLRTGSGTFVGNGSARRNPHDPVVPMIGEELAIARSLGDLASQLEGAARTAIASHDDRPRHLVS
jgi:hypothetical protein